MRGFIARPGVSSQGLYQGSDMTGSLLKRRLCTGALVLFAGVAGPGVRGQTGGSIELISVTPGGSPAGGSSILDFLPYHHGPSPISSDNRFVVFASPSSQIVAGDAGGFQDIFVRDRDTGVTTLVSRSTGGAQANNHSTNPAISANGRYVAFSSSADNLVAGDTNGTFDVFLRDLQTGATTMVSISSGGAPANYGAYGPSISADGRYVAFVSASDSLVAGDTNVFNFDVFVRDTQVNTTVRVSVRNDGAEIVRADSMTASISADGRRVAFAVYSNALAGPPPASAGPNLHHGIYVRDLDTNQTILASARPDGTPSPFSITLDPMISGNGRFVSFASQDDLDPGFPDADLESDGPYFDVFVRDLETSTTERVSLPFPGGPAEESGSRSTISHDGRYVAYQAHDLGNLRVRDRQADTTTMVLAIGGADPDGTSDTSSISPDGQLLWFESHATNLVPGDTNGVPDTFVFRLPPTPAIADLSLTLTANTTSPIVNSNVILTTTVANGGPASGTGVATRIAMPAGLTFVSASPAAAYASSSGLWTVPTVAFGGTATLQIVARVTMASPIDVVAQISAANEADPDSTPNNDSPSEDDQRALTLTPVDNSGIIVNDVGTAITGSDGKCTLIEAIIAANTDRPSGNAIGECAGGNGADTIHLRALNPPYTFSAAFNNTAGFNALPPITSDIAIEGAGATIQRNPAPGTPAFRLFFVAPGGRLALADVTVRNGSAATWTPTEGAFGGGIYNRGVLDLNRTAVIGNVSFCDGGGIETLGPLTVRGGSLIQQNRTLNCSGGGIGGYYAGSVTIADSNIRQNTAAAGQGGGFYIHGTTTATMTNSRVEANTALANGGGIFTHNADANLSIADSQVLSNVVTNGSGGNIANGSVGTLWAAPVVGGTMTLAAVTVAFGRTTNGYGAGISNTGRLTVTGGTIQDNAVNPGAGCGGGIFNTGELSIDGSVILRNVAASGGGGICAIGGGALSITGTTISGNTAFGGVGGGLALFFSNAVSIAGSAILANGAIDGGGLYKLTTVPAAQLVLDGTVVLQNQATGSGGGLALYGGSATLRNNTRVLANQARTSGGGILAGSLGACCTATVTMTGGTIDGNSANGLWSANGGGGGIASFDVNPASVMTLDGVTISNNRALGGGNGGGIFNRGRLVLTGGALRGNVGTSGGAMSNGTSNAAGGPVTLTNVLVDGNAATNYGGAIFAANPAAGPMTGTTSIVGGTLSNNRGFEGGALFIRPNAAIALSGGAMVTGNSVFGAAGGGGAVNNAGQLTATDTTFANNTADAGGAIFTIGSAILTRSTISGNGARIGAGLRIAGSVTNVVNSTISGNIATAAGAGAVHISGIMAPDGTSSARLNLAATTITDNVGSTGGIHSQGGLVVMVSSILAGNRRPDATFSECAGGGGATFHYGLSLFGQDGSCTMATPSPINYLIDPALVFTTVLGPLADNGGWTFTHALLPGSPAIDAGDTSSPGAFGSCPATDQRGLSRPRDGGTDLLRCDLGSVEEQTPFPLLTPAARAGGRE
jgi:Tol biopolymer transport system component